MANNSSTKNAPEVAEYKVLGKLKHDGKDYRKGSKVKLTADQAAALKPFNVIEPAK